MPKRNELKLFTDYRQHMELLTDGECKQLLLALFDYCDGITPELSGAVLIAFSFIIGEMSRDGKNRSNAPKNKALPENEQILMDKFKRFYAEYPRKEGKKAAYTAFQKLNPDEELLEVILSALYRQKRNNWEDREKKHIPLPASWLNGERWTDEICKPSSPGGKGKYDEDWVVY